MVSHERPGRSETYARQGHLCDIGRVRSEPGSPGVYSGMPDSQMSVSLLAHRVENPAAALAENELVARAGPCCLVGRQAHSTTLAGALRHLGHGQAAPRAAQA